MRNCFRRISPFDNLYAEAQLAQPVRRGLNWILGGNLFGTLHGIVCGGGTAALVGLAGMLGAGDMEFGLLVAIPQIAALMQIPFSLLVNRTHKRKIYMRYPSAHQPRLLPPSGEEAVRRSLTDGRGMCKAWSEAINSLKYDK